MSLKINDSIESNPETLANHFNNFFTSIADNIRSNLTLSSKNFKSFLKDKPQSSFFFNAITVDEVFNIILSLNKSKASGPYSIPDQILKLIPFEISKILANIFNSSFETGKFITALKNVKVVPVYKNKGSSLDVGNYRPISLLSNVDKIFEKIVYSRLIKYFDHKNIINKNQFGFRSKHSTNDALITITEQIRKNLDKSHFSCGTFIDLQKAFDTVDHKILLSKLDNYGIRGLSNQWFNNYLSGRKQFVSIMNHSSSSAVISHGVPQGSVLGPLLFLIYINDLPSSIKYSTTFLFADDTGILYSSPDLKDIEEKVNFDLRCLSTWLKANKIALNTTKTEVILFRDPRKSITSPIKLFLDNFELSFSSNVKYLGIFLDQLSLLNIKQNF